MVIRSKMGHNSSISIPISNDPLVLSEAASKASVYFFTVHGQAFSEKNETHYISENAYKILGEKEKDLY